MATIGQSISLAGIFFEEFQLPFNLEASITKDDIGKAVSLDSSAANTVKLAGDGETIVGRLETFEERTVEGINVGTVAVKFAAKLPINTGAAGTFAVGDTAVGSAVAGQVKVLGGGTPTPDHSINYVVEVVDGTHVVVVKP